MTINLTLTECTALLQVIFFKPNNVDRTAKDKLVRSFSSSNAKAVRVLLDEVGLKGRHGKYGTEAL